MLKEFENEIAELYESGIIKAPVHLRDGNEEVLTKIFEQVNRLCSYKGPCNSCN